MVAKPKQNRSKGKAASKRTSRRRRSDQKQPSGKHLVIVESPTKAKTINKYLGSDYTVMASVGHVRDLPKGAPKGSKSEVPGVDVESDFAPTYEVLPAKKKTVNELKKAAGNAVDVWFATDLDREGEAIAWHLSQSLGVPRGQTKRVVFNAITKSEIANAFSQPRTIDQNRVDAQQARRILDRIVGYQVSPLLWKKVAGGLSAGRVQSVGVRLVVEREREIEGFIPDEFWKITGYFTTRPDRADELSTAWRAWLAEQPDGKEPTLKQRNRWLDQHRGVRAELVEFSGEPFKVDDHDRTLAIAQELGFVLDDTKQWEEANGRGPARFLTSYAGHVANNQEKQGVHFRVQTIQTKRATTRPSAPFITSTLQQAAANQMGFKLRRTMRIAQDLYEGVDIHGAEGQTGLITYMRTDSTHLAPEAQQMARQYIEKNFGQDYLPVKPNVFTSSNKSAQEAHEAIRPTDVLITPDRVQRDLSSDQYKLYQLIWNRFVSCQMKPAQWDSTTVFIAAHGDEGQGKDSSPATPKGMFKATGRTLVFDGFYKVTGLPRDSGEAILPDLHEDQDVAPFHLDPTQHFTQPPPRYTEASLQKKLEEEGIGRPSTYAPIIQTIQDRKYVDQLGPKDRRLYATDLGKVVTDKLVEAFPTIMDVAYTRLMETELDKIEDEDHDWVQMLREFYGPFKEQLEKAHELMTHAKAETEPAPFDCQKCGAPTVYRFGRNGRFLSCSRYPDCDYAAPVDRTGNVIGPQMTDITCPICGEAMTKRTGRFGPFLGCQNYPSCKGILNLDAKKGTVKLPKTPPLITEIACPSCDSPLNLRDSKRGFWLACSTFPKCRGRAAWLKIEPDQQKALEKGWQQHLTQHPLPVIRNTDGDTVADDYVPRIVDEAVAEPG